MSHHTSTPRLMAVRVQYWWIIIVMKIQSKCGWVSCTDCSVVGPSNLRSEEEVQVKRVLGEGTANKTSQMSLQFDEFVLLHFARNNRGN